MTYLKLLLLMPLVLMALVLPLEGKNGNGKKHHKEKGDWSRKTSERSWSDRDAVQYRNRTERERFRYGDSYGYGYPRSTQGHRPNDSNGDGVISRHEWPGNDVSFRQLDRNRDGLLTDADRRLRQRRR